MRFGVRFIPARAGNTVINDLRGPESAGSSPHARGTPRRSAPRAATTPVHPRTRGEHAKAGLSSCSFPRFIPARAGNTQRVVLAQRHRHGSSPHARGTRGRRRSAQPRGPVHPRTRGEHDRTHAVAGRDVRFIPARAGNTIGHLLQRHRSIRFIPARAGNTTLGAVVPRPDRRFIPARAGNTGAGSGRRDGSGGSSPHARGTRRSRSAGWTGKPVHPRTRGEHEPGPGFGLNLFRFIPARAGNTSFAISTASPICGSSPHARGTRR